MIVAVLFGYFVFKIHILDLIGTIAGGMTSTPGLAAADSMSDSSAPSIAYATVYPIAMVFLFSLSSSSQLWLHKKQRFSGMKKRFPYHENLFSCRWK